MKKTSCKLSIMLSIVIALSLSAGVIYLIRYEIRSSRPGVVANVQIDIGASEIFSQAEIESAMDVVKNSFVNGRTGWCELVELWYNEYWSIREVERSGWDESNTIILHTYSYRGEGFENNIRNERHLRRLAYILFRDSPYESWVIGGACKIL